MYETTIFEAVERHVDRGGGNVARRSRHDLTVDRRAEGAIPQPQEGEQHELFELPEYRSPWKRLHIANIVYTCLCKILDGFPQKTLARYKFVASMSCSP